MADGRVNNGGRREGAGRKSTRQEYVDDGELTPLELMLTFMRDHNNDMDARLEVAFKAAPYVHARLQNTILDVEADLHIHLLSYLDYEPESEEDYARSSPSAVE